jgi:uncharacterized protein with HEPN domain
MTVLHKKYLLDILNAIELIETFMQTTTDFLIYENDLKTQSAVERQLSIIGEAVSKYYKLEPHHVLANAKNIINFRNRLVHAYDSIDNSIVWLIIKRFLPELKQEIITLL